MVNLKCFACKLQLTSQAETLWNHSWCGYCEQMALHHYKKGELVFKDFLKRCRKREFEYKPWQIILSVRILHKGVNVKMPKLWCKLHGEPLEPYCLQCHLDGRDPYHFGWRFKKIDYDLRREKGIDK